MNIVINIIGLLVCYYLVVEIKGDGNEVKILEVFCNSDMNFREICCIGFIMLEWVIDYLNIDLIWVVVSVKFRKKCGVDIEVFKKVIIRK